MLLKLLNRFSDKKAISCKHQLHKVFKAKSQTDLEGNNIVQSVNENEAKKIIPSFLSELLTVERNKFFWQRDTNDGNCICVESYVDAFDEDLFLSTSLSD